MALRLALVVMGLAGSFVGVLLWNDRGGQTSPAVPAAVPRRESLSREERAALIAAADVVERGLPLEAMEPRDQVGFQDLEGRMGAHGWRLRSAVRAMASKVKLAKIALETARIHDRLGRNKEAEAKRSPALDEISAVEGAVAALRAGDLDRVLYFEARHLAPATSGAGR